MSDAKIFLNLKGNYEKSLGEKILVDQQVLRTNFDHFDPEGSFEKLYQEVFEKVNQKNDAVEIQLKQLKNDGLYASRILGNNVDDALKLINDAEETIQSVKKITNIKSIRDLGEFETIPDQYVLINEFMKNIEIELRGANPKKEISPEEIQFYNMLDDPRGQDLRDIVMKFVESKGDAFTLSTLIQNIQSLFQKNQITIKINKR